MHVDLEHRLWAEMDHAYPGDVVDAMLADGSIASAKQAQRTLEKWAARGWYDYGVGIFSGWKTGSGTPAFARGSET